MHHGMWYRQAMDWYHIIDIVYIVLGILLGRGSNVVIKPKNGDTKDK